MLFNSYVFVFFLILVYSAYLLLSRRYNAQNLLLLIASYIFYAFWDWRFISLIATSTLIDFWVGRWIYSVKKPQHQKLLLALSIASNLSILGFFKYFNFFSESLIRLFSLVGFEADSLTLRIILPVGISFYTFQSMSYTFDVFRHKQIPRFRPLRILFPTIGCRSDRASLKPSTTVHLCTQTHNSASPRGPVPDPLGIF